MISCLVRGLAVGTLVAGLAVGALVAGLAVGALVAGLAVGTWMAGLAGAWMAGLAVGALTHVHWLLDRGAVGAGVAALVGARVAALVGTGVVDLGAAVGGMPHEIGVCAVLRPLPLFTVHTFKHIDGMPFMT